MNQNVHLNLNEYHVRIALLHVLQRMGIDTRPLELELTHSVAIREQYQVMWLQAVIRVCVAQRYEQNTQVLYEQEMEQIAADKVAHRRAKAAFWTMFIRAFASVSQTDHIPLSQKSTIMDSEPPLYVVALRALEAHFVHLQIQHVSNIQTALASVLNEIHPLDAVTLETVATRLLNISETERLTDPIRRAKLTELADKGLLGPTVQQQNFFFQRDKAHRLGTPETPGGLNLDIHLMMALRDLNLPIAQAQLVLNHVRPEILYAWQKNGQFQMQIDTTLKELNVFGKSLTEQQNPSMTPILRQRLRQKPAPSLNMTSEEDHDQEKEALDDDSVADKKRERSPLREMLKRAKKPWLIR